ncbi:MAG: NfeD family protein [Alphaproteobacteria bacterium]|nr:MAG: NfeD family protein [Alphaproteobacteria bacterium]
MIEFVLNLTTVQWFILAIALIGVEVLAPSSYFLWPGVSAFVVGFLSWLFPGLSATWEIGIFVTLAVATSVVWQVWFKSSMETTDAPQLNRRASQYVGRKIVLREDFVDGAGYVSIDDSRWRAESETGANLPTGTRVEVIAVDGVTLRVKEAPVEVA